MVRPISSFAQQEGSYLIMFVTPFSLLYKCLSKIQPAAVAARSAVSTKAYVCRRPPAVPCCG